MPKNPDDNLELYVRQDVGTGKPIVLLHGLFADGTQWVKITELLKDRHRVIVVDLLGHGRSPRDPSLDFSPEENARALRASLERLGATEHLTIVGYSMGGAVALSYTAEYQDGMEQLYVISTPFYLSPDQMIAANYAGSVIVTKFSSMMFRTFENLLGKGRVLDKGVKYADKSKKFHQMIGANDNKLDSNAIQKSVRNLVREFDFVGKLQQIKIPITFYAGKKDPFIVQGQMYALRKFSPYIDIERLDIIKIDHMLVQNLPKEIAAMVTSNSENTLHVYADEGEGNPLVLLHGIESSADYWDGVVPVIAKQRRVITVDLLGFGKSPKPLNVAYSLADQVQWLNRTLTGLGVTRFELAGHSLGSLVAIAYAAKYPGSVSAMTLFSPVLLPPAGTSDNFLLSRLKYFSNFSDTSYIYSHTSRAIGDRLIKKLTPSIRSVDNAVRDPHLSKMAIQASSVPTTFMFGQKDTLLDAAYIREYAKGFAEHKIIELDGAGHNFPLFDPGLITKRFAAQSGAADPIRASKLPKTFSKQIVALAAPVLWAKGLLYFATGALLFTRFAPAVLVIGLSVYVLFKGYKVIRGAFSLRYEGLSYIGYVLMGLFACLVSYGLARHPELSLKITVLVICALFLVTGLARLVVAVKWTKNALLKRSLIWTGLIMSTLGLAAIAGISAGIYMIVYIVGGYLILRGVQFFTYATGAFILAYIRGYNKR